MFDAHVNPVPDKRAGAISAFALVVASMVGTGVFTSLGYQLPTLTSGPQILILWLLGGIIALCGALCYATVAKALPKSGGEHHFLGEIYHPALGFMAGLLSAIVGFAAPTALSAIAFGEYLHKALPNIPVTTSAIAVIILGTAAHSFSATTSARVQVAATTLKLLLILAFLIAAITLPGNGDIRWSFEPSTDLSAILQPAFAISLFFVFYAYSGWNAAIYGLEEWHQPERTVHRALIGGTLLVTVLYIALNAAFLHAAPVDDLRNQTAVGEIAARSMFGESTARPIAVLFALGLFASVSAQLWAGPRVLAAMGRSTPALSFLTPKGNAPVASLLIQSTLALAFVLLTTFRDLVNYTQTGLTLCTMLTVAGLFFLGKKLPPATLRRLIVPAMIFLAMTAFAIVRSVVAEPRTTLLGLATAGLCALLWFPLQRLKK
jgi:APA family basic amino acid/polyamine antiporter